MLCIKQVEMAKSVDDLTTSQSIRGHRFPNIEMLDTKIALERIISNPYFKRRLSLEEQNAQTQDIFLRGRQIVNMLYEHIRVTDAHEAVLDLTGWFKILTRGEIKLCCV